MEVQNPGFGHILAVMAEVHARAGDIFTQVIIMVIVVFSIWFSPLLSSTLQCVFLVFLNLWWVGWPRSLSHFFVLMVILILGDRMMMLIFFSSFFSFFFCLSYHSSFHLSYMIIILILTGQKTDLSKKLLAKDQLSLLLSKINLLIIMIMNQIIH